MDMLGESKVRVAGDVRKDTNNNIKSYKSRFV